MKKVKCDVCGYKFKVEKEKVYTAKTTCSFTEMLSKAPEYVSVMDCPKCGCQVLLKIRMQRFDDDEMENKNG